MKLIGLHKKWMETKKLSNYGLCNSIPRKYWKLFELLVPSWREREDIRRSGGDYTYWASGLKTDHEKEEQYYSPLRQTIVLLICAMCDEI